MDEFIFADKKVSLKTIFENLKNYGVVAAIFVLAISIKAANPDDYKHFFWKDHPWLQTATFGLAILMGITLGALNIYQSAGLLEPTYDWLRSIPAKTLKRASSKTLSKEAEFGWVVFAVFWIIILIAFGVMVIFAITQLMFAALLPLLP